MFYFEFVGKNMYYLRNVVGIIGYIWGKKRKINILCYILKCFKRRNFGKIKS